MKISMKKNLKMTAKIISSVLMFVSLSGCAAVAPVKKIEEGRRVKVDYSCVVDDEELIATTLIPDVKDPLVKKSNGFIELSEYSPVELTAGKEAPGQWDDKLKKIEPEILTNISFQLPGMEIGKEKEIILKSEIPEGMKEKNRYRVIKRVTKVPRIRSVPIDQYKKTSGGSLPAPGDIIPFHGKPLFKVLNVSSEYVNLETITQGIERETPWGKAVTHIQGDMVVTTIEAIPGTIIKTGPVIGEITEVTEDTIKVDYGHPFAGRVLKCKVKVIEEK